MTGGRMPHPATPPDAGEITPHMLADLRLCRLRNWRQSADTRLPGADDAPSVIDQHGIVTLYPVSPEVPNLFSAYLGDPDAKTDSNWDSPSGQVYTWRWVLGRRQIALYAVLVRARPTWISWAMLPAALRLWSDHRTPDELTDAGLISSDAYRITQALDRAGGVLATGDLRREATFPTGKDQRAAFLKAIAELDARLLLAKTFAGEGEGSADEMRHALISAHYPDLAAAGERLTREDALDTWLRTYLPGAVYALPAPLAKHLKLPETDLRVALDRLVSLNLASQAIFPDQKGPCYIWRDHQADQQTAS
jgi:hypothetical protein